MSVELNGLQSAPPSATVHDAGEQIGRHEATRSQEQSGRPSYTDTVTLTDDATLLHSALEKINELPVMDTQRVEHIRTALEKQSYVFNYNNVASQLYEQETSIDNSHHT